MTATLDSAAADLQRANAELQRKLDQSLAERDAALAREAALAEVLDAINRSPGDPGPVFEAILEKAHALCDASRGTLFLFDGEVFRAAASQGYADGPPERMRRGIVVSEDPRLAALVVGERLIHVPDLTQLDDPVARAVAAQGVRTNLLLPLRKDGALLGVMSCNRSEVRPFTDKQIALLQNFAAQAVIAIENARLLGELRQRTNDLQESLEYQTATSEVLKVISGSSFDIQTVFDTIVATAARLCSADGANIWMREGEVYRYVSHASARHGETAGEAIMRQQTLGPGRQSLPGRVALEGGVVQIADIAADPDFALPESVAAGWRTGLGVPLLREGAVVGTINMTRRRVELFTERQIELVRTFADQAVIAIENARLITETQEALDQQTATAEILGVINASPGDLAPVFEAILEKAHTLCGAAKGALVTYDGERFRAVAIRGLSDEYATVLRASQHDFPGSPPQRLLRGDNLVQIPDFRALPGPIPRAAASLEDVRTVLFVPLRKDSALLGYITAYRQEVRPFSDKEIALLQNFGAQAVIAMENARLITETREALEQQTATAEVLRVISGSATDVQPVFEAITVRAAKLCEAEFGAVARFEDGVLRLAAVNNLLPDEAKAFHSLFPRPANRGFVMGRAFVEGHTVHVEDVLADPDYDPQTRRVLQSLTGYRTFLGVPILRDGKPIGVIGCARRAVRPFTVAQIELVSTFADQAVIAIENARLFNDLQDRTDDLQESLEYQTATSDVLKVISRSTFDLQPVLDTLLQSASRLCGDAEGGLAIRRGDELWYVATVALTPEFDAALRAQPMLAGRGSMAGRVALEGRVVHITDIADDPEYAVLDARNLGKLRTLLGVPLLRQDEIIGVITLAHRRVAPFTDRQIELVRTFADQAVIAIENARLLSEVHARTDELALRQAELRVTFDNMADGVVMFDDELRLAAWNRHFQELLDVPDALIAERPRYTDYVRYLVGRGEFGAVDIDAELERYTENVGRQWTAERTRPDGKVIEVRHNPVPSGGFVLIYADITERKRSEAEIHAARDAAEEASRTIAAAYEELKTAQARLVQAEKMASLGQLTAGIAHEIKNPLNFVNNFADLSVELLDELKETAAPAISALAEDERADVDEIVGMLTGNLGKIAEHGRRADGIVRSMLEHSRGESGERRKVDLNTLVEEALNLAYHGARAQDQSFNITLERDLDPAIPPIELVPQDMTRVFLNLFGNGFYAAAKRQRDGTRPGAGADFSPVLKVSTRDLGDAVEIRIRDNGTGIPPEIRDKLFQPFFTTKPTGEGTGLGLSISYDIVVQQHDGTIEVDSRVGEYTEFAIHLPRARQMATTTEAAA